MQILKDFSKENAKQKDVQIKLQQSLKLNIYVKNVIQEYIQLLLIEDCIMLIICHIGEKIELHPFKCPKQTNLNKDQLKNQKSVIIRDFLIKIKESPI